MTDKCAAVGRICEVAAKYIVIFSVIEAYTFGTTSKEPVKREDGTIGTDCVFGRASYGIWGSRHTPIVHVSRIEFRQKLWMI